MDGKSCSLGKVLMAFWLLFVPALSGAATAPEAPARGAAEQPGRERLIEVAREIMEGAGLCSLVTLDADGHPQARIMDAFAPDEEMVVWMGTNRRSRKVEQIRSDPRVTLFYFDAGSMSYVTVLGTAELVDDPEEKSRRWKEGWEEHYPGDRENYLLIRVVPTRVEVVSSANDVVGDPVTWTPRAFEFPLEREDRHQ